MTIRRYSGKVSLMRFQCKLTLVRNTKEAIYTMLSAATDREELPVMPKQTSSSYSAACPASLALLQCHHSPQRFLRQKRQYAILKPLWKLGISHDEWRGNSGSIISLLAFGAIIWLIRYLRERNSCPRFGDPSRPLALLKHDQYLASDNTQKRKESEWGDVVRG